MRNHVWYCLLAVVLSLSAGLLAGCGGGSSPSTPQVAPGALSLALVDGLGSRHIVSSGTATRDGGVNFSLGDLKGSRDFYFILKNTGGAPITDISLTSTNAAFTVTPSHIDVLDTDATTSVIPIIRVTARHGSAIDGVGSVPLMPMGANSTGLTITGTSGDTPVTLAATMAVNALVADFELYGGENRIDLTTPGGYWPINMVAISQGTQYALSNDENNNPPPKIINTGNVDITVSVAMHTTGAISDGAFTVYSTNVLHAGESLTGQDFPTPNGGARIAVYVYTGNVVCSAEKFHLGGDGNIYLVIR